MEEEDIIMQSKPVILRFSDAENGTTLEKCLEILLRHLPLETTGA